MTSRRGRGNRYRWAVAVGLTLLGAPVGFAAHALAHDWAELHSGQAALGALRDPVAFEQQALRLVLPRAPVALTTQDAVAQELMLNSRTLGQVDALRTAQVLCHEAQRLRLDPLLFVAVIHVESRYDHLAISPVGAEGLMQLMPQTASWMAGQLGDEWPESHSFDPVLNVRLGAHYLAHLQHTFRRLDVALTAYNRGPRATRYILSHYGEIPEAVYEFYAGKVLRHYRELVAMYGALPMA